MKNFKKTGAVLLCLVMLVSILAGCGKEPIDGYYDTYADMNKVQEQSFSTSIDITLMSGLEDLIGDLGDMSGNTISLVLEGTASYKNKQVEMVVSLSTSKPKMNIELTDVIIDGNDIYVNLASIFTSMTMIDPYADEYITELLGDKDYVKIDAYEDLGVDLWSATVQSDAGSDALMDLAKKLDAVLDNEIKNASPSIFTSSDNEYAMSMDGVFIKNTSLAIVANIEANLEDYIDDLIGLISENEELIAGLGIPASDFAENRSTIITEIKNLLPDLADMIENADFSGVSAGSSIAYDKSAKTYTTVMNMSVDGAFDLNINTTSTAASVDAVTVPKSYIGFADIMALIDEYNYGYDYDYDYDYNYEEQELNYDVLTLKDNPAFLDADVTGSEYLESYTIIGWYSEEEYNVPAVSGDYVYQNGDYLSTTGEGIEHTYVTYTLYGSNVIEFLGEDFTEKYSLNFSSEYYENVKYTDMFVSPDGSFAAIAMDYDAFGDHAFDIFLAYDTGIDDEAILINVAVWQNDMTDATATVLSELSALYGVDLSMFLRYSE